ncbi:hypothetical protein BGZ70_002396 [Mortierella alpina]|uniref:Uncharacterized protein n=1 Tax=Mortierella alpina TaxID=64518 RepID=A0A9P6LX39_MORAP|nr:hypothetical protein BGZ70_002396 [Mortierella alpina]
MRRQLYYINKLIRAPATKSRKPSGCTDLTRATWEHSYCEDANELLDVSAHPDGQQDGRQVVMSGTDDGLRVMSVTKPQSLEQCREHVNRYHVLAAESEGEPPRAPVPSSPEERRARAQSLKLPRPFKITAKYINDASHTKQAGRRREQRLRKNAPAKAALETLGLQAHLLSSC